ncbi:hypothetical protein AnigIFM59636_002459 [Aspergillus niger]|nr:hypothetical protein AnigIFM59636_002459 [Aspergillus niger]
MGHNRATCDSPFGSVAEGPCNRTGIKGPLSQGSFMACFDPHQLASTLQAMSEPMAMPHATKDSEGLLAGFYPTTPPNSPRTVPLEPVLTKHSSK